MDLTLDELEPGIALLTLRRPDRLNALTWELINELHDALEDVSSRREPWTMHGTSPRMPQFAIFSRSDFSRFFQFRMGRPPTVSVTTSKKPPGPVSWACAASNVIAIRVPPHVREEVTLAGGQKAPRPAPGGTAREVDRDVARGARAGRLVGLVPLVD